MTFGKADLPVSFFQISRRGFLRNELYGLSDEVELQHRNKVSDSSYADDIALLSDNIRVIQQSLDGLVIEILGYCLCFTSLWCKMLFKTAKILK